MTGLTLDDSSYPQVLKNGFRTNMFDFSALLLQLKPSKTINCKFRMVKTIYKVISQSFPARGIQQNEWDWKVGGSVNIFIL